MEDNKIVLLNNFLNHKYDFSETNDLDDLIEQAKSIYHLNRNATAITEKIIKLFPKAIDQTEDFAKLRDYLREYGDTTVGLLIEKKIVLVLSKINDFTILLDYHKHGHPRNLIENRMIEVLNTIDSFDIFMLYQAISKTESVDNLISKAVANFVNKENNLDVIYSYRLKVKRAYDYKLPIGNFDLEIVISQRLSKLLPSILPTITDHEKLLKYNKLLEQKLIDLRVVELLRDALPKISDLQVLKTYFNQSGHNSSQAIKMRIAEVVSKIDDLYVLIDYCRLFIAAPYNSLCIDMVKNRINERLNQINKECVPEDFLKVIRGAKVPSYLRKVFEQKVQELLA